MPELSAKQKWMSAVGRMVTARASSADTKCWSDTPALAHSLHSLAVSFKDKDGYITDTYFDNELKDMDSNELECLAQWVLAEYKRREDEGNAV